MINRTQSYDVIVDFWEWYAVERLIAAIHLKATPSTDAK
jgi:hypothetical protein